MKRTMTPADTDTRKLAYFIIPLVLSNLVIDLCDGIVVGGIGHLGSAENGSLPPPPLTLSPSFLPSAKNGSPSPPRPAYGEHTAAAAAAAASYMAPFAFEFYVPVRVCSNTCMILLCAGRDRPCRLRRCVVSLDAMLRNPSRI